MNGLEALKEIHGTTEVATLAGYVKTNIKEAFKKEFRIIEKELKALEIIKKYFTYTAFAPIDNGFVRVWLSQKKYVDIPQDEFNLMKEVLK